MSAFSSVSDQGWCCAIRGNVFQHSIGHIFIQFRSSRLIITCHYAQQLANLLLHLRTTAAEVKVHQLLNQFPQDELPASLRLESECLQECDAVFCGCRAAAETLLLLNQRGCIGWERWRLEQ